MVASYAPLRPPTERDTLHLLDGSPSYLGCLVSAGSVVDNNNTATPFNNTATMLQNGGVGNYAGTLAGKVLMLQPTAAGYVLGSGLRLVDPNVTTLVAQAATVSAGQACGPLIQLQERVLLIMQPTQGWLQWLPSAGAANCFVWELV